jgi:hypothetical protein
MSTSANSVSRTTYRRIQPYEFTKLPNGKIRITMLGGQIVIVSLEEATRILGREDLSTQRRTMYQAALDWEKTQVQQ